MERALAASLQAEPGPRREPRSWCQHRAFLGAVVTLLLAGVVWTLWPPAQPLEVDVSLFRSDSAGAQRLVPGGRVFPGDQLFLEIQGDEPLHVYVLDEDARGESFVLFPLPGFDLQNPLEAGVSHRLPGTVNGEDRHWEVNSAGGSEVVVVVAARKPLPALEAQIAAIPPAGSSEPFELQDSGLLPKLRGIGAVSRDKAGAGRRGVADRAVAAAGEEEGVWVWEIALENP